MVLCRWPWFPRPRLGHAGRSIFSGARSAGNSERNNHSPAATAAAQVKRAERERQEIGAAAAIERYAAHDFITQSAGNGAHQRRLA